MEDTDETLFVPLRLFAELDKGGLPSHDQNHEIVSSSPGWTLCAPLWIRPKQTGRAMEKTGAATKEAGEKMQESGKAETK